MKGVEQQTREVRGMIKLCLCVTRTWHVVW